MEIERERPQSDGIEALLHDVQCRALLSDEKHSLAVDDRMSEKVRDGL
nr:hypothetical protein [Microbacterium hydrocarbonoxydans]